MSGSLESEDVYWCPHHPIIWATTLVIRYIRYIEFWDPSGPGPIPNMNYIGFNIDNKNGPGPKWARGPSGPRAQVGPGPKRARAQVGPGPKWAQSPSGPRAQVGPGPSGPRARTRAHMDMDISDLGFHEISGRKRGGCARSVYHVISHIKSVGHDRYILSFWTGALYRFSGRIGFI